jgi:pimeloyl-ACP methyl ester carboxylesterase
VDVSTQRPVDETYEQPDPMGLVWSMTPPAGAALQGSYITSVAPLQIQCTAEVNASVVASAQMERRLLTPQVLRTEVRPEGLVATLFRPPGAERHPTVVVVGGSRGSLWEAPAALLASHGFVTLALTYFGIAPLPPGLVEIPLEYFGTALRWLQRQEGVNPHAVAVLGQSRGGELALLLGATFPDIRAVVAYVPSGVLWMGIPVGGTAPLEPPPAWTWRGRPLPFMRGDIVGSAIDWAHPPVALAPRYIAALHNRRLVEEATTMTCAVCGAPWQFVHRDLPCQVSEQPIVILQQLPVWPGANGAQYLLEDRVLRRMDEIRAGVDQSAELEIMRFAA